MLRLTLFRTFLLAAVSVLPLAAQSVDLIHLDPQPSIAGGCPATVHFNGRIRATGPMEVTYQWLRSDGSTTEYMLRFPRAQTRPVATTWRLSGNYQGWMQLVIVSPKRMQTAKALFTVNCGH